MNIQISPNHNPSFTYTLNNEAQCKKIPDQNPKIDIKTQNISANNLSRMEYELAEVPSISDLEKIVEIEESISSGNSKPQEFIAKDQFTFTIFKMPNGTLFTRITDHTTGKVTYYPGLDSVTFEEAMRPAPDTNFKI